MQYCHFYQNIKKIELGGGGFTVSNFDYTILIYTDLYSQVIGCFRVKLK